MTIAALSEHAEEASGLLFRTIAAHRAAVSVLEPFARRRLAGPREDREQIQCQATLVRLLSITESFCSDRLLEEVERIIAPSRHKTVSEVWDRVAISATNTWAEQQKAYKELLGVTLTSSDWKSVEQLAEARNAVAHGLGRLTRRQQRNQQSVHAKLASCGISVRNGQIIVNDSVLFNAAQTCRSFIERLDAAIEDRPAPYT